MSGGNAFGVIYVLIGHRHAPLLAVSIHTLRNWYDGPVAILAGDDAAETYAGKIAADPRAGEVREVRWEFVGGQRGSVYAAKCRMWELSPFERTVFLDADTLVAGDFSGLCPSGNEVVLTQFADWKTTGKRMRGRLMGWKDAAPILVSRAVNHSFPAVNTGVIGFAKGSWRFFKTWREVCERNISFICDEIAAQLVYPDFSHVVMDESYNWCPLYSKTPVSSARVIHLHGGFKKLSGREQYRRLWLPALSRAREENFAGICDWAAACGFNTGANEERQCES